MSNPTITVLSSQGARVIQYQSDLVIFKIDTNLMVASRLVDIVRDRVQNNIGTRHQTTLVCTPWSIQCTLQTLRCPSQVNAGEMVHASTW